MSGLGLQSFWVVGVLTLLIVSGPAQAQVATPLQRVADDAALAAGEVLAAGGGTHEAAVAAHQTIASVSGTEGEVNAAPGTKTVTVKVSQPSAKTAAVSTVRYVPPEQPAQWQWASRQRFVVKSSPVVVGSTCPQGCDEMR